MDHALGQPLGLGFVVEDLLPSSVQLIERELAAGTLACAMAAIPRADDFQSIYSRASPAFAP
jgi:hypothetical protein